jgi:hypothetical protein
MARDGEIDLSYIQTAEMLPDCFTKPLPKPAFLMHGVTVGMIGIGLGNGLGTLGNALRIEISNGIQNGLGNGHGKCSGTGNGLGNAIGK